MDPRRNHREINNKEPGERRAAGADVTKESAMSIIAVYGDALDKIGFDIARKANLSADKRLHKTLHTYQDMAHKNEAKYRKEKYELNQKLHRLRQNQDRVWREYATRESDEVGTTATGVLHWRARQLERSGILEQEEQEAREAETRLSMTAARRLTESRAALDDQQRRCNEGATTAAERDDEPATTAAAVMRALQGELHVEFNEDVTEIDDVTLTRQLHQYIESRQHEAEANEQIPDVISHVEHCSNEKYLNDEFGEPETKNMVSWRKQLGYDDSPKDGNIRYNKNDTLFRKEQSDLEHRGPRDSRKPGKPLRKHKSAPIIKGDGEILREFKASKKRPMEVPDILIDSTTFLTNEEENDEIYEENIENIKDNEDGDEEETEDVIEEHHLEDAKLVRSDGLLPLRKKGVASLLTPAYLKGVPGGARSSPNSPAVPRRVSSPASLNNSYEIPEENLLKSEDQFHKKVPHESRPRMVRSKTDMIPKCDEKIPHMARSKTYIGDQDKPPVSKSKAKANSVLRRVSTPNPPTQGYNQHTKSMTPVSKCNPSTSPKSPKPDNKHTLRDRFKLENKLFLSKREKKEPRYVIPDKKEMLLILEEQKQELQHRIYQFLAKQTRENTIHFDY